MSASAAAQALTGSGVKLCSKKTLDVPFLAYYGCSKLVKARAVGNSHTFHGKCRIRPQPD